MKTWKFIPLHEIPNGGINLKERKKDPYTLKKIINFYTHSSFKIGAVKKRSEFNDYDYIDKLNDKDKDWLYRFHREWLCADMNHKGKKFHKKKIDKKICYDKNNSLNRDIYARQRASHELQFLGDDVFRLVDNKNYLYTKTIKRESIKSEHPLWISIKNLDRAKRKKCDKRMIEMLEKRVSDETKKVRDMLKELFNEKE